MKAKTVVTIVLVSCFGLGLLIGIPAYKHAKDEEWKRVQELREKYILEDKERTISKIQAKHKEFAETLDDMVVIQDNMKYVFEHGGKDDKKVMDGLKNSLIPRMEMDWKNYPYYNTPFPKFEVDENGFIDLDSFAKAIHQGMIEEWEKARKEADQRLEKAKALEQPKTFGFF